VLWGPSSPRKGAQQPPTFRPMSIVAKRSLISATAELLFQYGGRPPSWICCAGGCAKFGWNRFSIDNMHLLRFRISRVWLENRYSRPQNWAFGCNLPLEWKGISSKPPKRYILAERRHHGLYGRTSCCISQWPSQCKRANFDPPQLRNRFIDFDEM